MEETKFEVPKLYKPRDRDGKNLKKFTSIVEEKYGIKFDGYWDLHKWSVDNLEEFWSEIWDFLGIIHSKKFDKVIDLNVPMSDSPKWFEGAELNFAENLLKYRDDQMAMILTDEAGSTEYVTYRQMFDEVKLYAAAFRSQGIKKGDIVVCYMSNRKEAIYTMQAALSIGAIFSGALPLLGHKGVLNRFEQVKPKMLVAMDKFEYQEKEIDMLSEVKQIVEGLTSLERVVILSPKNYTNSKDISDIRNSYLMEDFLKLGLREDGTVPPMEFEQVSFSHPAYISYTSGTTGKPKAILHGIGALMKNAVYFGIHGEADRSSIWYSVSPVGWVSWTYITAVHFLGYTLFLYDGAPHFNKRQNFWDMARDFKITHLSIPPSVLDEFQKKNMVPTRELPDLEVLLSFGTVVKPNNFDFAYSIINKNVMFSSCYGSTELLGFCLTHDMTMPVYRGEIPAIMLGDSVEVIDDTEKPVWGELGELVITKPVPSLPLGLWGDSNGSLFKEKYFTKYKGKFSLNDYAFRNPITKGLAIRCRSDETLKQRGCRFGSSEIYSVISNFSQVLDSLCVSQYNKFMEERAILFLKLANENDFFKTTLVEDIRAAIAQELTVRHVPDVIVPVSDIPYNINGKKMEITIKKLINHQNYNAETIRNPESLRCFQNRSELLWT